MTTKKIEFWCDLCPGWQDSNPPSVWLNTTPNSHKLEDTKRIKVTVELPCFGGSAEGDGSVMAISEVVKDGLLKR